VYLVVGVFFEHLRADVYALIKSLSVEPAHRQEKWVHFILNSKYY